MSSFEERYSRVRDYILHKVLGRYMSKHKNRSYYPVVVGGTNINRCLRLSPHTRKLLDSLFSSDVDLDFVIVNDNVPIDVVHQKRMLFLYDVLNDVGLNSYLKRLGNVRLRLDDKTIHMKHLRVSKMMLVTLKLESFNDFGHVLDSKTIMDCPLYHKGNVEDFRLYARFFPKLKLPIPYITHKGVFYATCGYIYYDTVRMMLYYSRELRIDNDEFNYKKLARYIIKFSALYLLMNKLDGDKDPNYKNIVVIYEATKKLLQDMEAVRKRNNEDLYKLIKKLSAQTDLKDLQAIIDRT